MLPFSLREVYLENTALGDAAMVESRIKRVRELLPTAGLTDSKLLGDISSKKGLVAGRRILTAKCVQCHDLRTVLARPRTPEAWRQTVSRMANRSTILNPITEDDQWFVTAYLIAVSPTLQETLKQRRRMEESRIKSQQNMQSAAKTRAAEDANYDPVAAKDIFEQKCSQCHSPEQITQRPPATRSEVVSLVQRMVANGLAANETELNTIIRYLSDTYANVSPKSTPAKQSTQVDKIGVEGRVIYENKFCIGCHGPEGKQPAQSIYPVLAGQNREYLVRQFKDIRDGARSNSVTAIMRSIVQEVTDEEIEKIADYLSSQ